MKITYTTTFTARCPADGTVDVYELEIVSAETILAEAIVTELGGIATAPAFQEDITKRLAQQFLNASVTTVGTHSGIKTVVEEKR